MITRFLTNVSIRFNPFRKSAKTCRIILASLPANARQSMKVNTQVLPRDSEEPSYLHLTFKDGKELKFDTEKVGITDITEEANRHSRLLTRKADLGIK